MPCRDPIKQREYNKNYYQRHKEQMRLRNKIYRERHKDQIRTYNRLYYRIHKQELLQKSKARKAKWKREVILKILGKHGFKCERCGFSDPRALEIHHIHKAFNHNLAPIKHDKVQYQILCANCHKIIHNKRKIPEIAI